MNRLNKLKAVLASIAFLMLSIGYGQTVAVGSIPDENLRMLQLDGKIALENSLAARPFFSATEDSVYLMHEFRSFSKSPHYGFLPVTLWQKINTDHPYGWDDAGMIFGKGYQALVSAGAFASIGPLSLQLQPEMVYAMNSQYPYNAAFGAAVKSSYKRVFPGQSSLRINAGPVSLGLSTENMWWG